MRSGFTLIQICLLLTFSALLMVSMLPGITANYRLVSTTGIQLNTILIAMRQYQAATGTLPCPADASRPEGAANYGIAAANPASGCTGGTPASNYTDAVNHVAIGMVPVRALSLPDSAALDSYGRKITYAVDTDAASCYSGTLKGAITVTDNGTAATTTAVLVSHGADGHGAFLSLPGDNGTATRLNTGSTDADQLTNAHLDASFNPIGTLSSFVSKAATSTFDDIVVYKSGLFTLNAAPAGAANLMAQITPPANNTYYAGEALVFTATYKYAVAVTGMPRLALTVGSNMRYANYAGGSGTMALTFSYTVQSADAAPSGISMAPAIDTNGGAITSACTAFTAPSLSGVTIKTMNIYVADYTNNRVEYFDSAGNYAGQFTGGGFLQNILNALIPITFNHPYQLAVDASGSIWVSDWGNSMVEKYSATGTYISQLGFLVGILPGQFLNPASLGFDAAGNLWIVDSGNNRVQKFNSSGIYQSLLGSYGSSAGQFKTPLGLALDSAGNPWVGDSGNNRLEKFTSSGSYAGSFGASGSAAGNFSVPCGQAVDARGNIWVTDSGNNRIEEFNAAGAYLGQFGSSGTAGGQFSAPCGIAVDLTGYVWVADTGNNRIEKFDASGTYLGQFGSAGTGSGQFNKPTGIALYYH